jgi:hypothetical protein
MSDGIVFDKASYSKGDTITITVNDSGRAAVPAGADLTEQVTFSTALASGQIVNGQVDVVTPGTPAVPAKPVGVVTATGGRVVVLVDGSDTGTAAKYTTSA